MSDPVYTRSEFFAPEDYADSLAALPPEQAFPPSPSIAPRPTSRLIGRQRRSYNRGRYAKEMARTEVTSQDFILAAGAVSCSQRLLSGIIDSIVVMTGLGLLLQWAVVYLQLRSIGEILMGIRVVFRKDCRAISCLTYFFRCVLSVFPLLFLFDCIRFMCHCGGSSYCCFNSNGSFPLCADLILGTVLIREEYSKDRSLRQSSIICRITVFLLMLMNLVLLLAVISQFDIAAQNIVIQRVDTFFNFIRYQLHGYNITIVLSEKLGGLNI
eukprot:gb/GEZN01014520.1/.p1 GENE.gb/GEZN01014520.1/~~gb/GEZN01014520.1/.p1  ORF type:complete len:285 (-),score=13.95 gb/GEZN01014520.1/:91-897(-)